MNELPHSLEAERMVLAHILTNGSKAFESMSNLNAELFFNRTHRIIFESAFRLNSEGKSCGLLAVSDALKPQNTETINYVFEASKIANKFTVGTTEEQCLEILEKKFALRSIVDAGSKLVSQAYENQETEVIINEFESKISSLDSQHAECLTEATYKGVMERMELMASGHRITGLKTGISTWDDLGGIMKGRLYVVAARAGTGKTSLIEQTVASILEQKESVLVFQNDMSPELMFDRMTCRDAGISFTKYDLGQCTPDEYSRFRISAKKFNIENFRLYSPRNFTPSDFVSIVRREKRQHGIKCVILDHILSLKVSSKGEGGKDLRENITLASKRLVDCLRETKVPQVIVSQLNREGEGMRPKPSQIMQFDGLLCDCDMMFLLWNNPQSPLTANGNEVVTCTVGKNRFGPKPEDDLIFDTRTLSFK